MGILAIVVAVSILLSGIGSALTVPHEEWNNTFGGTNSDSFNSVIQTSDSGYIFAGQTFSFGTGNSDGWLIKTDSFGIEQWNRTFGGSLSDSFYSVVQISDGEYIATGRNGTYDDVWLIKIDNNGSRLWDKTYNYGDVYNAVSIPTSDGGYAIAGGNNNYDAFITKTDEGGNEQWHKIFVRLLSNSGNRKVDIRQTLDGGYILISSVKGNLGPYDNDIRVIKTDSYGNEQWNKTLSGKMCSWSCNYDDGGNSIEQIAEGYIIAGYLNSGGSGGYAAWLIRLDTNGNELWNKTYSKSFHNILYSVRQTLDGGYIVAGHIWTLPGNVNHALVIKTDINGNEQWSKTFVNRLAYSVRQTMDSGYILAGDDLYDAWTIKLSSDGITPLTTNITLPANDSYSEESVNFSGNVSGGEGPYTYTWSSDIDGTLNITTTANTTNEFSKNLTIGKHNISSTVQDSLGTTKIQTVALNVVVQKIGITVVLSGRPGDVTEEDKTITQNRLNNLREFYLRSSYGAIYLDFKTPVTMEISSKISIDGVDTVKEEVLEKLTSCTACFADDTILIIDDDVASPAKDNRARAYFSVEPHIVPPVLAITLFDYTGIGTMAHELGHTLGDTVKTSERSNTHTLLWDLYQDGPTGNLADPANNQGSVHGWDLMANGNYVFNDEADPMDLSSLSKVELGWLARNEQTIFGTYEVTALESAYYRDPALVFKHPYVLNTEYVLEARKLTGQYSGNVNYGGISTPSIMKSGAVVYQHKADSNGKVTISNLYTNEGSSTFNVGDPTFLASDGVSAKPYINPVEFIEMSVVSFSTDPFVARIQVMAPDGTTCCVSFNGVTLVNGIPIWYPPTSWQVSGNNSTYPDLDLHAYTADGNHTGMNYISGAYENEIPGAIASGDLLGGEEWIFVPKNTEVRYSVDSRDVQQYLNDHPEINVTNASMDYFVTVMEYGANPQFIQLPDGSGSVAGRNVSASQEQTIAPGISEDVNITPQWVRYISGTVRDSINKTGIPYATVTLNNNTSTTTNETGFYSFNVIENAYNLATVLNPEYYTNNTITISTINIEVTEQDIELLKKPTGTISGGVVSI